MSVVISSDTLTPQTPPLKRFLGFACLFHKLPLPLPPAGWFKNFWITFLLFNFQIYTLILLYLRFVPNFIILAIDSNINYSSKFYRYISNCLVPNQPTTCLYKLSLNIRLTIYPTPYRLDLL